jgi:hypothetical protein
VVRRIFISLSRSVPRITSSVEVGGSHEAEGVDFLVGSVQHLQARPDLAGRSAPSGNGVYPFLCGVMGLDQSDNWRY